MDSMDNFVVSVLMLSPAKDGPTLAQERTHVIVADVMDLPCVMPVFGPKPAPPG